MYMSETFSQHAKRTHTHTHTHTHLPVSGYLLVAYAFADALGDVVGNLLGTFLYKDSFRGQTHTHTPSPSLNLGQIALCNLLFAVLLMGPALFYLYDKKICSRTMTRPIKEELRDIWRMVQRKSLLLPMMFVAVGFSVYVCVCLCLFIYVRVFIVVIIPGLMKSLSLTHTHTKKHKPTPLTGLPNLLAAQLCMGPLPHQRVGLLRVEDGHLGADV
jgi:hypothetical protein